MPNTKRARRTPRTRPTAAEAVVDDPANDGDKGVAASAVAPLEARFLADLSQLYDDDEDDDDDEEDEVDQDGKVVGKRDWLLDRPALRLSKQPPMTTATAAATTTASTTTITEEEKEEDEEGMPSQQSTDEGSAPSRRPDALLAQPEEGSTTRRRRRRIGGALSPLGSVDGNAPPRRERGAHVKGTIDDPSGDVTKTATMAGGEPPAALTPEQMQQGTMPIAKTAGGRTRTMFLTLHHL
jgi:hypothetical protein